MGTHSRTHARTHTHTHTDDDDVVSVHRASMASRGKSRSMFDDVTGKIIIRNAFVAENMDWNY